MPVSRISKAERNSDIRTLFHLYELYKRITLHHLSHPAETPLAMNALYRNKLVHRINQLVDRLDIATTSRKKMKLPYIATPFLDLFSAEDIINTSGRSKEQLRAEISAVQGRLKDVLEDYKASYDTPIDEVTLLNNEFDKLFASNDLSRPIILLGEAPKLEATGNRRQIIAKSGNRKYTLGLIGSFHTELLVVLLVNWGKEYSCTTLIEKVNARTTKKSFRWENVADAMRTINKVVHKAGYRRLKITIHGNTYTVGYTEKAQN